MSHAANRRDRRSSRSGPPQAPSPSASPPASRPALVVALATAALYGVLAIWACVSPDFRAPDEPQHVSTLLRLAYSHSYPAPGDARIYPPVKASYPAVGFGGIGLNTIVGMVPLHKPNGPAASSLTMRQLGAALNTPVAPYDYDQMTQHPPGYYAVMAIPARLFDVIDKTPRDAVLILRLCSALLLLPLPFLVFRIASVMGATPSAAAAASFLPLALPQLMHIGGAVNNDSLTITLGAAVTWLALEVALRPAGRRWAVALGVATAALLLTKGIGLPMLGVVVAAYGVRALRWGWRSSWPDVAVTFGLSLVGLAWWVANVVRFGTLQPDGYPASYLNLIPRGTLSLHDWFAGFFPAMTRSFFADFGWLEAPPPSLVTAALTFVVLAVVVVGVLRAERRHRALVVLAQLSWLLPLVAILYTSHHAWLRERALQGVQGRYLFVGVAALAATFAVAARGARRWHAAMPLVAVLCAALGLYAGVAHFYAGTGLVAKVGVLSAWSPLRLRVLVPVGVVVAVAAIGAAMAIWNRAEPAAPAEPAEPAETALTAD